MRKASQIINEIETRETLQRTQKETADNEAMFRIRGLMQPELEGIAEYLGQDISCWHEDALIMKRDDIAEAERHGECVAEIIVDITTYYFIRGEFRMQGGEIDRSWLVYYPNNVNGNELSMGPYDRRWDNFHDAYRDAVTKAFVFAKRNDLTETIKQLKGE